MTALRDAAEQAESLAHQTATAAYRFAFLAPLGGPDPLLAAETYRLAVATVGRLADLMVLLGTAPEGRA